MDCKDLKNLVIFSLILALVFGTESLPPNFYQYSELLYLKIQREIANETADNYLFGYNDQAHNGPKYWPGSCSSGLAQSPIAYDEVPAVQADSSNPLVMTGSYFVDPLQIEVINNGQGATLSFVYLDRSLPQITGGPLENDVYNFASFHFHYPCEHMPKKFAENCELEVHFVHYNSKYGSLKNAVDKVDGLAVIGLMYKVGNENSHKLPYAKLLKHVYAPHSEYTENRNVFSYADAIGFSSIPKFVSYKGSLTTPMCSESVTWIVVDKLYEIPESNMKKFLKMKDDGGEKIKKSNRPVQPINGRKITEYH